MTTTILMTGFAPFGGDTVNPSWEAVRALDGAIAAPGATIVARCLPCEFGAARRALHDFVAETGASIVICVGQAGGRPDISVERIAINVDDARIPDNAGQSPVDVPVVHGGPAAYFSTLPIKAIVQQLREAGIPASVSQTAGTFVCNHVFYGLMHAQHAMPRVTRAGFIHIPYLPGQAVNQPGAPSMPLAFVTQGLLLAAQVAVTAAQDVQIAGGATH
ncbi:MAG TPA: pyroglutamyl-peptidase I [Burkholderiaceae bacterium]